MENWIIKQVKLQKDKDGLADIVGSINWELQKTKNGNTVSYDGTIMLGTPDKDNFVEASELNENVIKGWLEKSYTAGAKSIFNKKLDFELAKLTDRVLTLPN